MADQTLSALSAAANKARADIEKIDATRVEKVANLREIEGAIRKLLESKEPKSKPGPAASPDSLPGQVLAILSRFPHGAVRDMVVEALATEYGRVSAPGVVSVTLSGLKKAGQVRNDHYGLWQPIPATA